MPEILIINNTEPGIREFAIPFEDIINEMDFTSKVIEYRQCLDFDFSKTDGIILTGSPQGDDIVEHHLPYFRWLQNIKKPVLGVCAGHHVTGYLYGSELRRSQEPESGDFEVEIIETDPIFNSMPKKIKVKQMHNDSISLPPDFDLLATSASCENQLMKHKSKPLYTCQFHPEFYNHVLIQNFLALCK